MTRTPFRKILNRSVCAGLLSAAVFIGSGSIGSSAWADTVHLKRGGSIEGEAIEKNATVDVLVDEGSTTFNKTDIERIDKSPSHPKGSWNGILARIKSAGSSAMAKVKAQTANARRAIQKKTANWDKPVGYKKESNPYTLKKISDKEKKRIS